MEYFALSIVSILLFIITFGSLKITKENEKNI